MYELLHAGFDTLDIAIQGALPKPCIRILEEAKAEITLPNETRLVHIGPGNVALSLAGHGMRGGYAYVADTGPVGAKWMIKANSDSRQWNVFISPSAAMLLCHGWEETVRLLWEAFQSMGGTITDHSINRVDFAMDFQTQGFEPKVEQFVAHGRTGIRPHLGNQAVAPEDDPNHPTPIFRGRKIESVTIGKMPGRQVIFYDKRKEVIARQKTYWFEAWDRSPEDEDLEVWRIEVRAGKQHLSKHRIKTIDTFRARIEQVLTGALESIRYLDNHQTNANVSRQAVHPLWEKAQEEASAFASVSRPGMLPETVLEIDRDKRKRQFEALLIGTAISYAVVSGYDDYLIFNKLGACVGRLIHRHFKNDKERAKERINRSRERFYL